MDDPVKRNLIVRLFRRLKNDPRSIWIHIFRTSIGKLLSDEQYVKIMYYVYLKQKPNLSAPKTFNEKLQWLKLHDHNPEYTKMVDKYAAKKWVADRIGEQYIIPTLGVWEHFGDIDFDALPNQFVLKCTHDSGGLVIVKDKNKLDKAAAKWKIEKCLKRNFYWIGREWPYKNVPPRVIAEQYMSNCGQIPANIKIERYDEKTHQSFNRSKEGLTDYKIYCFNGTAKLMMVASNRFTDNQTCFDYFDREGKWLDLVWGNPRSGTEPYVEADMEELFETAEKLATGIPHVRVDLYYSKGQIYFGEMTLYDGSGFSKFESEGWDELLGDWIGLQVSDGGVTR